MFYFNILTEYFNEVFCKPCNCLVIHQSDKMSSTPCYPEDAAADTSNYFYKMFNVGGDTLLSPMLPKQLQKHEESSADETCQEQVVAIQPSTEPNIEPNFINVMQMQSLHDK